MGTSEESGAGGSQWYGDQAQWYPETAANSAPTAEEPQGAEEAEEPEEAEPDAEQDADRTIDDRDKRAQDAMRAAAKVRQAAKEAAPPPAVPAQRAADDDAESPEQLKQTVRDPEPAKPTLDDAAAVQARRDEPADTPNDAVPGGSGWLDELPGAGEPEDSEQGGWFTPPARDQEPDDDPADRTVRDGRWWTTDENKPAEGERTVQDDEAGQAWWQNGQTVQDSDHAAPGPPGGAWPVQDSSAPAAPDAPDAADQTVLDGQQTVRDAPGARWEAAAPDPQQNDWNRWSEVRQPAPPEQPEQTTAYQAEDLPFGFGWQQEAQPQQPLPWPGAQTPQPPGPVPTIHQAGLWHRLHFPIGAFLVAFGVTNLVGTVLRWGRHRHDLAALLAATVGGGNAAGGVLIGIHVVEVLLTLVALAGLLRRRYVWYLPGLFGWVSGFGAFGVLDAWAGEFGRLAEHAGYFAGFTALLFLAYALGVKSAVGRQGKKPGAPQRHLTRTQEMALAALSGWQRPGS